MTEYINIHTHKKHNVNHWELLNADYSANSSLHNINSLGIHPWKINGKDVDNELELLEKAIDSNSSSVFALGECGMDRAIDLSLDKQEYCFIKQVKIAEKFKLPLIIHCVKAWSDLLKIYNELTPEQPWIFHGFNGNAQIAQQLLNHNSYLSFGKALLKSEKVQEVFIQQPLSRVFFETDDEPLDIAEVYNKGVRLKSIKTEDLKTAITNNRDKVFNNNGE